MELWRAADPKRRQAQMDAAIPFKDLAKGKHTHAAYEEVMFRVGITDKIAWREGVQRCECGAVRAAHINRAGEVDEFVPWTLSGYLMDYRYDTDKLNGPMTDQELAECDDCELEAVDGRWDAPMTFSDVLALCEPAHKWTKEEADELSESEGDCYVEVLTDSCASDAKSRLEAGEAAS